MVQAKAIWDALPPGTSIRKGAEAIEAQGLTCAVSTLGRWIDSAWTTSQMQTQQRRAQASRARPKTGPRPETQANKAETASAKVSKATEAQEGKLTRLDVIMAEEAAMKAERERLLQEKVLDSELARTAMRESLIAQIVLARQITRRAAVLVEIDPETAAKLLHVLKQPAASTTVIVPKDEQPDAAPPTNGDNAKVVEGKVIEKSHTQLAIENFRNRRAQGVAA